MRWRRFAENRTGGDAPSFDRKLPEMTGPYRASDLFLLSFLYTNDVVARFLPKRQKDTPEDRPLRVLVANWAHLGDVVTILPLLKFLESHPRVKELGVLIASWSRPVLESSDIAARIHIINHWALDRSNTSMVRKVWRYLVRRRALVEELARCDYDVSIDTFSTFPSTHGVTWSASIPRRIGFRSGGLGPCLTDPFDWIPDDRYILEHQLELLKPIFGGGPHALGSCYPGFAAPVPGQLPELGEMPYVVIHMGGAQDVKAWAPEKWIEVVSVLQSWGYEIVATGSSAREIEAVRRLSERLPIRDLTGRLSWQQFVATAAGAAAVVSIDSVTGHIAACFGVPAVIITSGRVRLGLWRPNNSNVVMLTHAVGCAPCCRTNGCAAMACLRLVEASEVLSSLEQVLNLGRGALSGHAGPVSMPIAG